jgi:hypothetical protein
LRPWGWVTHPIQQEGDFFTEDRGDKDVYALYRGRERVFEPGEKIPQLVYRAVP